MTALRFTLRGRDSWHRKPPQTSGQRLAAHGKVRPMGARLTKQPWESDRGWLARLGRIWRGER